MKYEKGKVYTVEAPTRALRQHYAALAKVSGCYFHFMKRGEFHAPAEVINGHETNLNTATHDDLCALNGVGPARAQRIIGNRPYGCVDDLLSVPGTKEHVWRAVIDGNELSV